MQKGTVKLCAIKRLYLSNARIYSFFLFCLEWILLINDVPSDRVFGSWMALSYVYSMDGMGWDIELEWL